MKKPVVIGAIIIVFMGVAAISFWAGMQFVNRGSDEVVESVQESTGKMEKTEDTEQERDGIRYRTIKLYYYDYEKDKCNDYAKGIVPVERKVADSDDIETIIKDTLNLWLQGELTAEENDSGLSREISSDDDVKVTDATIDEKGILTLTFSDPQRKTSGGSCHAGVLYAELEAIVWQFTEIKSFSVLPLGIFEA